MNFELHPSETSKSIKLRGIAEFTGKEDARLQLAPEVRKLRARSTASNEHKYVPEEAVCRTFQRNMRGILERDAVVEASLLDFAWQQATHQRMRGRGIVANTLANFGENLIYGTEGINGCGPKECHAVKQLFADTVSGSLGSLEEAVSGRKAEWFTGALRAPALEKRRKGLFRFLRQKRCQKAWADKVREAASLKNPVNGRLDRLYQRMKELKLHNEKVRKYLQKWCFRSENSMVPPSWVGENESHSSTVEQGESDPLASEENSLSTPDSDHHHE